MRQFEQWKYRHDDAWFTIKIVSIVIIGVIILVGTVSIVGGFINADKWVQWENSMNKLPCEKVWEHIIKHDHYHQQYYDYYGDRC